MLLSASNSTISSWTISDCASTASTENNGVTPETQIHIITITTVTITIIITGKSDVWCPQK